MTSPNEHPPLTQRSVLLRFVRWLFRWSTVRRVLLTVACFATLVALFYAEENWRGKRAWEKFRREWEAKGERFDLAAFVPKRVPDEQNFAKTPFFAPSLEYEFKGKQRETVWKDTNALERTRSVNVLGPASGSKAPSFGGLERGDLTDLRQWQEFYRGNTNFPSPPQPGDPARDVLFALRKFDPVLNELHEANRRPYTVFPIHYDENYAALLPYLSSLKSLSTVLRLRAAAFLAAGQNEDALRDIKLSFRIADSVKSEPLLISQLVRIAVLQVAVNSIWESLTTQRWSEPQLRELQQLLAGTEVLADHERAMRGERAFNNDLMDKLRRRTYFKPDLLTQDSGLQSISRLVTLAPTGWLYQNQLCINRLHQERTLPLIDAAQHRAYPEKCAGLDDIPELRRTTPYNVFARMLFPAVTKAAAKTARSQATIDLATVACALERFRLANGQYPDQLQTLVPRFIEKLPPDLINGEPLKYRRIEGGRFLLYSVGWNQADDGGIIVLSKSKKPSQNIQQRDWVWRYPAKE